MKDSRKIIRGHGGGKSGGGEAHIPVEAPDTLHSIQYASILDLISEGEIGGLVNGLKSVYLDDTPLQNEDDTYNFSNVTVVERTGTQSQAYIPGFSASEAETPVSTEIKKDTPVVRSISNVNDTAARVTISIPALTFQSLETGDMNGSSVEIAIDIQNNGGGFVQQALREVFETGSLAISDSGAVSTIPSDRFQIVVKWRGQNVSSPQSCTFELQYRAVGDVTWLVEETYTFTGNASNSANSDAPLSGGTDMGVLLGGSTGVTYPTRTKTFEFSLADDEYEFRVVKTGGTRGEFSTVGATTPTHPSSGINIGGSVAITGGAVSVPAYTDVISGKTTSRYQRSYRLELPAGGPWDIRVRRITDDSLQSNLQNQTYLDSITEIIDAKLTYPNSAIIGINIDAKQFNNIPTRGYDIYGLLVKVPSNYNPLTREYTGTWDGTFTVAWTDNPAWIYYDLITNDRYGLGEFVSEDQVDKWGLYTIGQYCDVMVANGYGGYEPRFTCNIYLQTREEAYTVVANLASVFRAITYWSNGEICVSQDSPKDVEQLFTKANIVNGQFSYSGSSGSVRHTVVLVSWNDPQDGYRQKIEYVADDDAILRYGIIQTEILAMGCTSRGQAARVGRWLIYTEQNETETIQFRAGMDSVFVAPGSIIATQDPNRAGARMGGRILSATANSIELDSEVTIASGTYTLFIHLPDGTVDERTVTNVPGITSTLTVSEDFTQTPQRLAVWILAAENLQEEKWRVVSIAEVDKTQFEIAAITYRADKYVAVEQDLKLDPIITSLVNGGQPATPTNLNIQESLYLSGLSVVGVAATVGWDSVSSAASYLVTYQLENQNPVTIDNIRTNNIDIKPITEGDYVFKVYALNALGRRSQANTVSVHIYGKSTPPADVTAFSVIKSSGLAMVSWALHPDLDVQVGGNIVVRHSSLSTGAVWTDGVILEVFSGNAISGLVPLMTGTYMAKALDSTGHWSDTEVSFVATEGLVTGFTTVATSTQDPSFSGTSVDITNTGGVIQLAAETLIDDITDNIDDVGLIDYLGGIIADGSYYFDAVMDLGSVATYRFETTIKANNFDIGEYIDSREDNVDDWGLIDGSTVNDCDATLYASTTNDNPAGSPTWSAYTPFFVADFTCRAARFRLDLLSGNPSHNISISQLRVKAKVPT